MRGGPAGLFSLVLSSNLERRCLSTSAQWGYDASVSFKWSELLYVSAFCTVVGLGTVCRKFDCGIMLAMQSMVVGLKVWRS